MKTHVLLGGLFSGVFTPTEAAAVAAIYAILLGSLVYRNLGPRTLLAVLLESARQSTVVMLLIASAFIVNYAITTEQIGSAWPTRSRRSTCRPSRSCSA